MHNKPILRIVYISLLISIQIILTRCLSISLPFIKITFGFLPSVIIAIVYGPIYSSVSFGLASFIGATLFPVTGYFVGFTISAFLSGFIFGVFLYKKPKQVWRVLCSVLIVSIVINLFINTLWLSIVLGQAYRCILAWRISKLLIMPFIMFFAIWYMCYPLIKFLKLRKILAVDDHPLN